jgi:nitrite reductase/ring-hydroxylating ferredoxin subunit
VAVDAHLRLSGQPAGWYAVAFASELPAGAVLRRRLMNRELVVYRTEGGTAVVMDGYCPHLGAHLAEGGRVEGETLRCPFHGLGFASDGSCSGRAAQLTGIGKPIKLRARTWPVRELHGAVLVYAGPDSQIPDAPAWEIRPVEPEHAALDWSPPVGRLWRIRTQPQEIIENTVDIGHFSAVHGYREVAVTAALATDGPHLTMGYRVVRDRGLLGKHDPSRLRFRLDITASGVGYSRVQVVGLPLRLRTVVMPTPIDDETTEVRVITQVALPPPLRLPAGPGRAARLGRAVADRIAGGIGRIAAAEMGRDFAADIRIWEHKRYQDPPRLVAGDGPIGPYRTWARQFYRSTAGEA